MDSLQPENAPEEATTEEVKPAVEETVETSEEVATEEPKPKGVPFNKRINQLTAEKYAKDREIQALQEQLKEKQKAEQIAKPNEDDFDNRDDYVIQRTKFEDQEAARIRQEAIDDYKVEQEQKNVQRSQQRKYDSYTETRSEAVNTFKDYETSELEVNRLMKDYGVPGLAEAILDSDNPAAIIDHYGKKPQDFETLANSYLTSPMSAARTLGKLETRLERKKPAIQEAPKPVSAGGRSAGSTGVNPKTESQFDYNRRMNGIK